MQGDTLLPAAALTLSSKVCSNSERGLLGVAMNRFLCLFYTFNKNNADCPTSSETSPVERIARFTIGGRCGIPTDATAVTANVTVASGFAVGTADSLAAIKMAS